VYAENRPPAALRDVVECFDIDSEEAFVVGTMTRPLVVPPDKLGKRFGVRFRPWTP